MKENRSVTRMLSILELIAKHDEGLTLGQIYRILNIPKATVYDFLQTLYKADAIYYKDPRLKNYVIGSKMFAIGSVYTKNSNLIEAAQYQLKNFALKYGRTVFITKRVNDKIVYVFKHQPSNSKVITPQEVGSTTRDFEHTSVGRAYAAFDEQILHKDFQNYNQIKKLRYSESNLEESNHISTISTPVWNFENRVVGVLVSSVLITERSNQLVVVKDFLKIAENISRKLGYMGNFEM